MGLVMKAPGRIYDQNVGFSGGSRYERIKQNGGRVGSLFLLDYLHTGTLRPYLELVACCGPKRIGGANQHLVSFVLNTLGELSDSRRFPDTIYADDHQNVRLYRFVNAALIRNATLFRMVQDGEQ